MFLDFDFQNLYNIISEVDFFESCTPEQLEISAQIAKIGMPEQLEKVNSSHLSTSKNHDFDLESANVRAWIISKIGFGNFQKVLKSDRSQCQGKTGRKISELAEKMNEESYRYSQQFINTFSTTGTFTADDLWNIVDFVPSIAETKAKIARELAQNEQSINDIADLCESIENVEPWNCSQVMDGTIYISTVESDGFDWVTGEYITVDNLHESTPQKTEPALKTGLFCLGNYSFNIGEKMNYYAFDGYGQKLIETMIQKAPKQFKYATRNTLNIYARDIHHGSIEFIKDTQTIRNKSVVEKKGVHYDKTKLASVDMMTTYVGTRSNTPRFTGFGEQEGIRHKRKRFATVTGRRSKSAKIAQKYRMNPNNDVDSVEQFLGERGLNKHSRIVAWMARLMNGGKVGGGHPGDNFRDNKAIKVIKAFELGNSELQAGVHSIKAGGFIRAIDKVADSELWAAAFVDKMNGVPRSNRRKYTKQYHSTKKKPRLKISGANIEGDQNKLQPTPTNWLRKSTANYFKSGRAETVLFQECERMIDIFKRK